MKKIVILLFVIPFFIFFMILSAFQNDENEKMALVGNDNTTARSCKFDDTATFKDAAIENMRDTVKRKIINERYINVVLSIYAIEKENISIDDISKKINEEIEYAMKNDLDLKEMAYIQGYKFGVDYFDFLKKNDQEDSSPYFARKYIEEHPEKKFEKTDDVFAISAIKQMSDACAFDGNNDINDLPDSNVAKTSAMGATNYKKLMAEATKYIGMPYVYGGSSPATSCECSGFVIWAYGQTNLYKMDRITAQGIFNKCARVDAKDAKPGDLVFFQKTYDFFETVTHIGIYVGNNKMLHCGDPIGYANLNDPYWREHLYAFGRLSIESLDK